VFTNLTVACGLPLNEEVISALCLPMSCITYRLTSADAFFPR
jgi:hypothetical protein